MTEIDSKQLTDLFPDLDIATALGLAGGMPLLLVKIMRIVHSQYKDGAVSDLEKMLAAGDYESASRHAHTLKGLAGNIGAHRFRESCLAMEMLCKSSDPKEGMDAALAHFRTDAEATMGALAAGLDRLP